MTKLHNNESADEYAAIIIQIDSRTRVIRCRHNLQWIFQRRTSADLNKGHWVGLSYHTSWESLTAPNSGVREALNANLKSDAVAKDDVVLDDFNGQG